MIFAPVGVESLEEHEHEGRRVEKVSQYRYQTTQLHLMMTMNETWQEFLMLSTVTLNCRVTKIS